MENLGLIENLHRKAQMVCRYCIVSRRADDGLNWTDQKLPTLYASSECDLLICFRQSIGEIVCALD